MYEFIIEAHRFLSNAINIYPLVLGIWGIVLAVFRRPPDGNYNGALVIAVGLFAVQTLVGVILLVAGGSPDRTIHFLYGVAVLLVVPGIFAFTRGSNTTRESLLYGVGLLFVWGLAERAVSTAGR